MHRTPVKDPPHISVGGHPQPPNPILESHFISFQIYIEISKYLETKDFVCSFSSLIPKNSREPVLSWQWMQWEIWITWLRSLVQVLDVPQRWEKKFPLNLGWGILLAKEMWRVKLEFSAEGWNDLLSFIKAGLSCPHEDTTRRMKSCGYRPAHHEVPLLISYLPEAKRKPWKYLFFSVSHFLLLSKLCLWSLTLWVCFLLQTSRHKVGFLSREDPQCPLSAACASFQRCLKPLICCYQT